MSKQMRRLVAGAGAAAMAAVAGGFLAQPVSAAQHTANLAVSASVTTNCRVAAGKRRRNAEAHKQRQEDTEELPVRHRPAPMTASEWLLI